MTEILVHNFEYMMKARERFVFGLFALGALLAFSYAYFMERSVLATAEASGIQASISHQSQAVNALSEKYLAASRGVTLQAALAMGFEQAKDAVFVAVPSAAAPTAGPAVAIASRNAF